MSSIRSSKYLAPTLAFAAVLSLGTTMIVPDTAQALDFKKLGKQIKKDFGKAGKNLRKSGVGKVIVQGVGVGLLASGIARDSPAAMIIGVALVAAPEVFKQEMAKNYGSQMQWSGCTRCYKQRIVVVPGRSVSDEKRRAVSAKIKEDIKDLQRALAKLGLYTKRVDGDFGPGSRKAVKAYQTRLGSAVTGYLTAEERYQLFVDAAEVGYVRKAVLDEFDETNATIKPTQVAAVAVPTIPEYRLAQSQLERFSADFLTFGPLTAVKEAQLLPDGMIALNLLAIGDQPPRKVVVKATDLEVSPHNLSDQWIKIIYHDPDLQQPTTINTRDDFASVADASKWMTDARNKISIISKLTGVEQPVPAKVVIAANEAETEKAPSGNEQIVAQAPATPGDHETGEAIAGSDGRIVVSELSSIAAAVQGQAPTAIAETDDGLIADKDGTIVLASGGADETVNNLNALETGSMGQTCRQNLYVSFDFPEGDDPINHYNIVPPEGMVMIDNGDRTAYFVGSCIRGHYDFSYVHVEEAKAKEDWKHFERKGSFEIASNSEQCAIDLNTPDGSASVQCL